MEENIGLGSGEVVDRWRQARPLPKEWLTHEQLQKIAPVRQTAIDTFLPYLNANFEKYSITTKQRIAAFLAQVLHESMCFKYVREIWGPTTQQKKYERDFNQPYKAGLGRNDRNYLPFMLGNSQAGDGKFFSGHGLIQITGRTNHAICSKAMFGNDTLLTNPTLLEVPEYAVESAFWFCVDYKNLLDEFDSKGVDDETRKINGGLNGIDERRRYYECGVMVLS